MTRNFVFAIRSLPIAAVAFTLVWLIGLAIPVPMIDVDASPASSEYLTTRERQRRGSRDVVHDRHELLASHRIDHSPDA